MSQQFFFKIESVLKFDRIEYFSLKLKGGHDHLLEICLLKKSARHVFSFARHNNYFFCQLLELQMVDKGFGKYQLLETIYCKENGVHVQQLG